MSDVSNYNNSRELNAFWDNFLSKVKERVNYMVGTNVGMVSYYFKYS